MATIERKQKIYITLGVTLALIVATGVFILWPWWQDIQDLKKQIFEEETTLQELNAKEVKLKNFSQNSKTLYANLKILKESLLTEQDALNFILETEKIASQTNTTQTINLETEEKEIKTKTIPTQNKDIAEDELNELPSIKGQIVLEGEFNNIIDYIKYFEAIIPLAEITKINLTTGGTGQQKAAINDSADNKNIYGYLDIRVFSNNYENSNE